MSSTRDLVDQIKAELRQAGMTYADVARGLGMAESSIKRMFAAADMPLSRVDEILRLLKTDFADLARRMAERQPQVDELPPAAEQALVADPRLLLVGICVLSHWTFEQIVSTYRLTDAQCIACLAKLDRLGVVELRPMNRYRLKLSRTFRWRPHGPVMRFFRDQVAGEYFDGRFDGADETLSVVHGSISRAMAPAFVEKIHRVAQDFAQQHLADQRVDPNQRDGYTLVMAMRSWEFSAFTKLRRPPA